MQWIFWPKSELAMPRIISHQNNSQLFNCVQLKWSISPFFCWTMYKNEVPGTIRGDQALSNRRSPCLACCLTLYRTDVYLSWFVTLRQNDAPYILCITWHCLTDFPHPFLTHALPCLRIQCPYTLLIIWPDVRQNFPIGSLFLDTGSDWSSQAKPLV